MKQQPSGSLELTNCVEIILIIIIKACGNYQSRFGNLFLKLSGKRRKFILNFKRENMLLLVYNIGLKSHKCFNNVLATSN